MILIKISILLMILIIIYNRITFNYSNRYPTTLYFGLKGSGKSTMLTKIALQELKKGNTVYSNFYIPGCILYDPKRLGEFYPEPESTVICDEIALVFNNRNYQDFPKNVNEFITLQRKHRVRFVCATQIFDSFDKKIRGQIDKMYQIHCYGRVFVVAHQIIKDIRPTEDGSDIAGHYKYAGLIGGLRFAFVPRYVEYFNSFDPPILPVIYTVPLPMSDLQRDHLSLSKWLKYSARIGFLNMIFKGSKWFQERRKKKR